MNDSKATTWAQVALRCVELTAENWGQCLRVAVGLVVVAGAAFLWGVAR